jgi:amino acid transporter
LAVQNQPVSSLPFRAALYPYGTYFALGTNVFLIFFQGYTAFLNPFSAEDFVINYILLPVFVGFVVGWKVWHRTRFVKLSEMDVWSGRRERAVEEEDTYGVGRGSGFGNGGEGGWKEGSGWRGRAWRTVVG